VSGTGSVCRLTVLNTAGLVTGTPVIVAGLVGATECNGTTTVSTVVDGTHLELAGTTFTSVYVSGGTVAGGQWTATSAANWASTTGGTGNVAAPISTNSETFDANSGGGTVTVNTNLTSAGITATAFTGTLDWSANNNTVTINGAFLDASATSSPTVNGGTGLWTVNSNGGTPFTAPTGTNFNFGSTPITFGGTPTGNRQFVSNGQSFGAVTLSSSGVSPTTTQGAQVFEFTGAASTFASLTVNGPALFLFPFNLTTTITGAFTGVGTSAIPLGVENTNLGSLNLATVSIGSGTCAWCSISGLRITTGALSATNSVDLGGNSASGAGSISITVPDGGGGNKIL
jgi:hypothetical protein